MQTSLFVIRHGRTIFNAQDRYLGALDPPLDEDGLRQAAALAGVLAGRADVLVCSPKLRARQTAGVLAAAWSLPVVTIGEFAEREVGVYEGLTREEARAAYPALWEQDITRRWDAAPTGGETIRAVFERVARGLAIVQRDFAGRSVVLVAHGFVAKVIRALLADLSRDDFFRYSLANGQVALYTLGGGAFTLPTWHE
ncbi:histidine phosphatase family protein [Pseudoduganella lutea]|uniref:phosphoglycerate mutase (2,3-diphosphoglycerate-dependent) n=1 Tax=Pseudoduganella lutea TaxID=321985 RepID=A0A4P6L5I2_9BURK|nr:histidine phosphatase family protein [Pseudoduganella lutea]QBE66890.1 histidine phosphatase family protein [Pseudoduganella lutea]